MIEQHNASCIFTFKIPRHVTVVAMIAGLLLAGCSVDPRPQDIANFSTNRAAPIEDVAEYNGTFYLYGDDSDKTVGPIIMTKHLNKGDPVGFEFDDNHAPVAVAGKDRIQLTSGRYRWQMNVDRGQVDWNKTDVVIVEVVLATAAVAIIVGGAIVAVKR